MEYVTQASVSGYPQVTKIFQKKKNSVTYSFRQSFSLYGMQVLLFENQCKSVRGACCGLATSMCTGALVHAWPCALWQETASQLSPCSQEALRSPVISPSAWFPEDSTAGWLSHACPCSHVTSGEQLIGQECDKRQ